MTDLTKLSDQDLLDIYAKRNISAFEKGCIRKELDYRLCMFRYFKNCTKEFIENFKDIKL